MTYNEFLGSLPDVILQRFPKNAVRTVKRYGVNDVEKDQLFVADSKKELAVAIPIRELYESYQLDSVERVYSKVEDALRVMEKNHGEIVGEVKNLCYEEARVKLRLSLCNYAWSRKYLEGIVYFRWLDLAMVVYLEVGQSIGRTPVSAGMLQSWGVTPECVYLEAMQNMQETQYTFRSLYDQFVEMGVSDLVQIGQDEPQYILSSRQLEYGAIYMAVPGVLKKCVGELGVKQVLVFPSSVHEVMLVPVLEGTEITDEDNKQFSELIVEINQTVVAEEERLADHAYIYKREEDRVYVL